MLLLLLKEAFLEASCCLKLSEALLYPIWGSQGMQLFLQAFSLSSQHFASLQLFFFGLTDVCPVFLLFVPPRMEIPVPAFLPIFARRFPGRPRCPLPDVTS